MNDGSNGASADPVDVDPEPLTPGDQLDGQWLPAAELAKMLGLTAKAITALGESGDLVRTRPNPHRPWLYKVPVSRLQTPTGVEQVIIALRDAVKLADFHSRESFRMVHEPAQKLHEQYATLVGQLTERCKLLETAHTENIKARESAMSEAHVRELATLESMRKGERWDAVFKTLGESMPMVVSQIFETYMEWKGPKGGQALEMIRGLRVVLEQLDLPLEVKAKLEELWKREGASSSTRDTTAEEVPTDGNA